MIYYKSKKQINRTYAHLHLNDIFDIDKHIKELPKQFVLLLCCDSTDYQKDQLSRFAACIVENGLCFLDIYGKGSSQLELLFDRKIIDTKKLAIATVSYDNEEYGVEEIEEALSYFINHASPSEKYKNSCKIWLCITVKNKTWENHIKKTLSNVDKYYKRFW